MYLANHSNISQSFKCLQFFFIFNIAVSNQLAPQTSRTCQSEARRLNTVRSQEHYTVRGIYWGGTEKLTGVTKSEQSLWVAEHAGTTGTIGSGMWGCLGMDRTTRSVRITWEHPPIITSIDHPATCDLRRSTMSWRGVQQGFELCTEFLEIRLWVNSEALFCNRAHLALCSSLDRKWPDDRWR